MTNEHADREAPNTPREDETGGLADSARRHLAYERLSKQIAASEAAARLVLAALARAGRETGESERTNEPKESKTQGGVYGDH